MKCDKCGFVPNPGDKICINCGAKLSLVNEVVPELEKIRLDSSKKIDKKYLFGIILIILGLIIIIFFIIKKLVLKV